jgi:hypothetical protein
MTGGVLGFLRRRGIANGQALTEISNIAAVQLEHCAPVVETKRALATALPTSADPGKALRATAPLLVVSIELPSVSFPNLQPSPVDVIAATRFGDGAAAAALAGGSRGRGSEILAAAQSAQVVAA